ncbi:MAG: efflux RND transporter permease subunit, partial [Gemmatimonadota bacterium]
LELTERIDAELERIQAELPEGIAIDRGVFRQADFISLAVDNVTEALRDGVILVVVILFLFLWNFRTTAISVLAIPLSLAAAFLVMRLFGVTVNTMTLGGLAIAIGALVDDAIIDVENTYRRLRENRLKPPDEREPALRVVYDAAREVRGPIVNATLIITVVFVPLFFLSGVEGRMLRPLGLAYIVSILASLLVAVSVTPALCAYLLPNAPFMEREGESWLVERLKRAYRGLLGPVLARPGRVMAGAGAALAAALAVVPFLGSGFLPSFQEGTLTITAVTAPGTHLEMSDRLGTRLERVLLEHPGVVSTARRTGRAELDEHAQGVNAAEIDARLDLSEHELEEVMADLRESLAGVPGTNVTIGQPIGHRIDHMLSGTRAAIAVKVFGPDLYELRRIAGQIRTVVEGVPGTADVATDQQADVPQLRIEPDRAAIARYGLTPGTLVETIDAAFAGEVVSQVLEGRNTFDLVVRFDEASRADADRIARALIDTPTGAKVALGALAEIRPDRGPNRISREDVQRKIVVQSNVAGRDVGGVVADIRSGIQEQVSLPTGYFVEYGGQFESGRRATRMITLLSLLAVAAIFVILFQEFGSARTALLVMVNLPLALVGGIFAVLLTDGVLNVATLVGFITLFGIAVRNGILLVSHYNHLLGEGKTLREAVVQGSMERLNPILMTALTAGLALIPLALGGGEPGKEIQAPLAVVVLGGLLTSTALNMFVVPTLFLRYGSDAPRDAAAEPLQEELVAAGR